MKPHNISKHYIYIITFSLHEISENSQGIGTFRQGWGRGRVEGEVWVAEVSSHHLEASRVWTWDLYGKVISHNQSSLYWNSDELLCSEVMLISSKISELRHSLHFTCLEFTFSSLSFVWKNNSTSLCLSYFNDAFVNSVWKNLVENKVKNNRWANV